MARATAKKTTQETTKIPGKAPEKKTSNPASETYVTPLIPTVQSSSPISQSVEVKNTSEPTPSTPATEKEDKEKKEKKPKFPTLEPIKEEPLPAWTIIEEAITKPQVTLQRYVPFVQSIDIFADAGHLVSDLVQLVKGGKNRKYEGGIGILFRKNIYISGALGGAELYPKPLAGDIRAHGVPLPANKTGESWRTSGTYGHVNVGYMLPYDKSINIYIGLRYGRSYFQGTVIENGGLKYEDLTENWLSFIVDTNARIAKSSNWYLGGMGGLKLLLGSRPPNTALTNYAIPGYGRSANTPSFTGQIYIKYSFSLTKKYLSIK